MKKIISIFSALTLVATSFVALATAASAEESAEESAKEKATLRYVVTYDDTENPYAKGKTGKIEFYCDNLELISVDDMDTYFAGIDTVGITAKLDTTYLTSSKLKISSPALANSTRNYNNGTCTVQWGTADYESYVYNMTKSLFTIKFTIEKELTSPIEITLSGCNINVGNFDSDGAIVGGTYYGQTGVSSDEELIVPKLTVGPQKSATAGKTQDDGDEIFYTDAVEFIGDSIKVKVTNDKVTDKSINETLEREGAVLGGKTKILPIIKYTPGADLKGSTFTIVIGDKTYTYKIAE